MQEKHLKHSAIYFAKTYKKRERQKKLKKNILKEERDERRENVQEKKEGNLYMRQLV